MQTLDILEEVQRLPLAKKFQVVEEILKIIKEEELKNKMDFAAEELYNDYKTDKELTAFTALDLEDFYEAK